MRAYVDCEVRAVIRFFIALNRSAPEIYEHLPSVYGDDVMSIQMVRRWIKIFKEGRTETHDLPRSGRPAESMTFDNIQQIRDLLEEDRRMTITDLCIRLQAADCSRTSVGRIVHDILRFRKLSSRWVPRLLTDQQKLARMGAALQFLSRYASEGEFLIDRIVTGDETWVHHCTPESKEQSKEWCEPGELPPKKAKVTKSVGKVMATVFWDLKGILLV